MTAVYYSNAVEFEQIVLVLQWSIGYEVLLNAGGIAL